jgi:hypothetical protein
MSTTTTVLIVGGVGVAVVGGVLVWKHWQAAKAAPAVDKCAAFANIVGDVAGTAAGPADLSANSSANLAAYWACKLGSALPLDDVASGFKRMLGFDGPTCDDHAKKNIGLNGAPAESFPAGLLAVLKAEGWVCGDGTIRYANGCSPYVDTATLTTPGGLRAGCVKGTAALSDKRPRTQAASLFSGRPWNAATKTGDPTTRKHIASMGRFPLTVPTGGTAWYVRGKPMVCKAGEQIALDQRTGGAGTPVCWPTSAPPPERRSSSTDAPGYGWFTDLFGSDGKTTHGTQVPTVTVNEETNTTTYDRR